MASENPSLKVRLPKNYWTGDRVDLSKKSELIYFLKITTYTERMIMRFLTTILLGSTSFASGKITHYKVNEEQQRLGLAEAFVESFQNTQEILEHFEKTKLISLVESQSIRDFLNKREISLQSRFKASDSPLLKVVEPGVLKTQEGRFLRLGHKAMDVVFIEIFEALRERKYQKRSFLLQLLLPEAHAYTEDEVKFVKWAWNGTLLHAGKALGTAGNVILNGVTGVEYLNLLFKTRALKTIEKVRCQNGQYFLIGALNHKEWQARYEGYKKSHKQEKIWRSGGVTEANLGYWETMSASYQANLDMIAIEKNGLPVAQTDLLKIWPSGNIPVCTESTTAVKVKDYFIRTATQAETAAIQTPTRIQQKVPESSNL